MNVRPVSVMYSVLEFKAFGRNATPYHIANSAVLSLTCVFLFLAMRELNAGHWLSFAISLVFALLPHYSTDRVWISASQTPLSIAFAFIGIYALARSKGPKKRSSASWAAFAILAFILSILTYEVALGLIAASIATIAWQRYVLSRSSTKSALSNLGGVFWAVFVLLVVGVIKVRHQTIYNSPHHLLRFLERTPKLVWHAVVQAVRFNLWTYGLKMPSVLGSLFRSSAISPTAMGVATVIAFVVAAYLWRNMAPAEVPSRRACFWLVIAGFVVFGLGFALFFPDPGVNFSTAGLDNRIEIASALGASCVLVAVAGLSCSVFKPGKTRARAYSITLGLICGMNSLVLSGISFFWADAASRQASILISVAKNVSSLPNGSVLLLDGFCRYSGPGVVFETDWDASGAIQLTLHDSSLTSDIVSPNLSLHETSVNTSMYGEPEGQYAYGNRLFVYNVRVKTIESLSSTETATSYFRSTNPTGDSGCPAAKEGDGERIF